MKVLCLQMHIEEVKPKSSYRERVFSRNRAAKESHGTGYASSAQTKELALTSGEKNRHCADSVFWRGTKVQWSPTQLLTTVFLLPNCTLFWEGENTWLSKTLGTRMLLKSKQWVPQMRWVCGPEPSCRKWGGPTSSKSSADSNLVRTGYNGCFYLFIGKRIWKDKPTEIGTSCEQSCVGRLLFKCTHDLNWFSLEMNELLVRSCQRGCVHTQPFSYFILNYVVYFNSKFVSFIL